MMKKKSLWLTIVFSCAIIIGCSNDDGIVINNSNNNPNNNPGTTDPVDNSGFIPCENGLAGNYPCNGIGLVSRISLAEMGGRDGNDCWGWTDPDTGKEYAIMGTDANTTFIDISDAENPVILGSLPTATSSSTWRDIKVYNNYAFIVSEASSHGMQIFDLTKLRSVTNTPESFTSDEHYTTFGSAHNIVINEDSGYAYAVGTNTFSGGPQFINIQNPLSPQNEGGYSEQGYTHDAQVITYNGPDSDYTGREIYIGSNEDKVVFIDVTNKDTPIFISDINYTNVNYTHQGWVDESQTYFFLGDETDEINLGGNTRTIIFDITNLDEPVIHFEYNGPTNAIDHNGYVNGNEFYIANYTAGIRIIDISDVANKNISETAFFDSHPQNNNTSFNGAWSVYPFFESGNILISDINAGLFIVRKNEN